MTEIKKIRISKGISQGALAESGGVALVTIKKLESGLLRVNRCKLDTLIRLSKGLNVKVVDLLPKRLLKWF